MRRYYINFTTDYGLSGGISRIITEMSNAVNKDSPMAKQYTSVEVYWHS